MKKKPIVLLLATAILIAGLAFAFSRYGETGVVHPMRGPAIQAVYATGTVEPGIMFPLAPRYAARLMALMADEGQTVKKGDTLARLEDADLQKSMESLLARADEAQKEYSRKAELFKTRAVSQEQLDRAQADRDAAAASVAQAQAQLDYMKLVSPADGVILRRDGEVGELIPVNRPVFWMSCCLPLRISAEVDEEDISLVQPGERVVIAADAFPGKIFNGTVSSITPKGDPVARSYRVRIALQGETPLMIGMTAETNIIVKQVDDALLVPASAIIDDQVWMLRGGRVTPQKVVTGIKTSKAVEVTGGLGDGASIVLEPGPELRQGNRVRPVFKEWQDR